jgi:hypothetical protein
MEIKTSGKAVKGEKHSKQEAALKEKKKRSSERKATIESNRKKAAEKAKPKKPAAKPKIPDGAKTAGMALLGGLAKGKKGKKPKLGMLLVIVVVAIIAFMFFRPQLMALFGGSLIPDSLAPDEVMGYNSIDFQEAILGEARERSALIVWEQDVQVDSEISNAFANLSFLKKTKMIHTFGTGKYTVELGGIDNDHIKVDDDAKTVTITVPHSVLDSVSIFPEQTTFEDTEHTLPIKIGDIKLTQEQQNELDKSIDTTIREELNKPEHFAKADEVAIVTIQEIFQPLVTAVSDQFEVLVVQE